MSETEEQRLSRRELLKKAGAGAVAPAAPTAAAPAAPFFSRSRLLSLLPSPDKRPSFLGSSGMLLR